MDDSLLTALASVPVLIFAGVLGWWLWTRPLKIRPITDADRAEFLMNQKFQRVWYIADQALVERDVLGRRRVELGWMQVARERRRVETGRRQGYGNASEPIYYHFPPVINVRVRYDVPLELGLDLRSGYARPFYVTADEGWIPEALLALGAGEAIEATSQCAFVYANDEEVVVEFSALASQEQLAWATARANAIAGLLLDAKRRLPRTRPFADLLDGMRGLAVREGCRIDDDAVTLEGEGRCFRIIAGVTRERYACFKLGISMPFASRLPGTFYIGADHRDELDKFFASADLEIGDAKFDERFILRGDHPALAALLSPDVRRALVQLGLACLVELEPGGMTVRASGLTVEQAYRAIELTFSAAPVVAARVEALSRPIRHESAYRAAAAS